VYRNVSRSPYGNLSSIWLNDLDESDDPTFKCRFEMYYIGILDTTL
jgi:hypothetical protein